MKKLKSLAASAVLLLASAFDRPDLISIDRRSFVLQVARSALHSFVEVEHELVMTPVEKPSDVGHLGEVLLLVDRQYAGRRAALDLMLKTRSRPLAKLRVGAGPKLKVSIYQPERLSCCGRRVVGPKVLRAVWLGSTNDFQPWPRSLRV